MDQHPAIPLAGAIPPPLHFIGNRQVPPASGQTIPVIDPSDGQVFASLARGNRDDIDLAVRAAEEARDGAWGKMAPADKGRLLMRLSQQILEHHEELAQLESRDCGKPLKQARADATACARYFEFYAGAPDKLHGDTTPYLPGYTVLPGAKRTASPVISFRGTIRCRYSAAASAARWRRAGRGQRLCRQAG